MNTKSKLKVVLIDDNDLAVQSIIKITDWHRFNCRVVGTANDGVAGFELVRRVNPDIVVTDIRMPGYDGLELIGQLRELGSTAAFIIISGYSEFDYAKNAIRLGVSDFLVKPITKDKFEEALGNVVSKLAPKSDSSAEGEEESELERIHREMESYPGIVRDAIAYIESNIHRDITLSVIAEREGVTPNYVSRIFKKSVGIGFSSYVTLVKMNRARRLLENPQNKAYEVAAMLGYSDYAYFFQVFKKEFGYAPTDKKFNKAKGSN